MSECIFCKIINKEINSKIVYEDENILAFNDINPKADVHILIVPKKHVNCLYDVDSNDQILNKIHNAIKIIAKNVNIEEGFRIMINNGEKGGQEVFHLHYHLLAMNNDKRI